MRLCALVVGIILSLSATGPHAAPIVAGYERFGRQAPDEAARVEAGLLLLGELGCVNCHAAGEPAAAHLAAKAGPGLDAVGRRLDPGWLAAYLADPQGVHPGTTMPDLLAGLSADRRSRTATALTHFLASTGPFAAGAFPGSEQAKVDAGLQIYERHGCAACHGSRRDGVTPLADHRPLGDLAKKWSPVELVAFLKDPTVIRPAGRMPALPPPPPGGPGVRYRLRHGQSARRFASLIRRPKRARSPLSSAASSSGVLPTVSLPAAMNFSFTSGRWR